MFLREALQLVRGDHYAGHHEDGSSIQKHSAGSNYPYIVRIHELVELDAGFADVIDSMDNVLTSYPYTLGDKEQRLAAYEAAFDAADAFATAKRLGVVR